MIGIGIGIGGMQKNVIVWILIVEIGPLALDSVVFNGSRFPFEIRVGVGVSSIQAITLTTWQYSSSSFKLAILCNVVPYPSTLLLLIVS